MKPNDDMPHNEISCVSTTEYQQNKSVCVCMRVDKSNNIQAFDLYGSADNMLFVEMRFCAHFSPQNNHIACTR